MSSLKGICVGTGRFLFGPASMATSVAMLAGGLVLMVLPSMTVGNELLILPGVGVIVGAWFLAHRHGRLQGIVDANRNGIDDRLELALKDPSAETKGK